MKIILTHIGSDIPAYAPFCLRQFRFFNPSAEIYFIVPSWTIKDRAALWKEAGVMPIASESLENDRFIRQFRKKSWFKKWGTPETSFPSRPDFWHNAIERLFFIETLMRRNRWESVFHFENDVMIYTDLARIENLMPAPRSMRITPVGAQWMACGLFYIDKHESLGRFRDFVLKEMGKGEERIRKDWNIEIASDMTLLKVFGAQQKILSCFPVLPEGPHAYDFESFNSVFDGASWGQFAGGTNNGHVPGFIDPRHYVGKELLEGRYRITWTEENGLRVPFVEDKSGKRVRLNNLHVHSKKLGDFMSRDRVSVPARPVLIAPENAAEPKNHASVEAILKNIAFANEGRGLHWQAAPAVIKAPVGDEQLKRDRPKPYILKTLELFQAAGGKNIVEIGTSSSRMFHRIDEDSGSWGEHCCNSGHSTMHFAMSGAKDFWTVDINAATTASAKKNISESEYTKDCHNVHFVTQDGLEFLKNFDRPIDLLYLDGWDVAPGFYAEQHLMAYLYAKDKLHDKSLILIDDTDVDNGGKGKWVVPKALEDGYRVLFAGRQTLLAKSVPTE